MATTNKLVGIFSQCNEIVKRVGNGSLDSGNVCRSLQLITKLDTSQDLVGVAGQINEIVQRVGEGSLEPDSVRRSLQLVIEKKAAAEATIDTTTPKWWSSPKVQVDRAAVFLEERGFGVGYRPTNIPAVPDWKANSETEELLLTVMLPDRSRVTGYQPTVHLWWYFGNSIGKDLVRETPGGNFNHVRMTPGREFIPGIRWMTFDPNQGQFAWLMLAAAIYPGWPIAEMVPGQIALQKQERDPVLLNQLQLTSQGIPRPIHDMEC